MLHVKYRPKTFDDFYGNELTVDRLRTILNLPEEDRPRAFLFYGRRGAGKTTLAGIIIRYLQAEAIEVTGAGVADIRDLLRQAHYNSLIAPNKVFIIDEAHRLSKVAVDELLKEVEEPKKGIYYIFCTNEFPKLPETLRSRLTSFEVRNLDSDTSIKFLAVICKKEGIKPVKKTLSYLASRFEGNPRDMLVALGKIRDIVSDSPKVKKAVEEISSDDEEIITVLRTLVKKPTTGVTQKVIELQGVVTKCHEKIKKDPELARMAMGRYLTKVTLNPNNWEVAGDLGELLVELGEPFNYNGADIKLIGLIFKIHNILLRKWEL